MPYRKRFLFLSAVFCVMSHWSLGVGETAERSSKEANSTMEWQMPEFMISRWAGPSDDERAQQLVEAGFNTVMAGPPQPGIMNDAPFTKQSGRKALDFCARYGFRVILNTTPEEAATLCDHPALWGYYIFDEPVERKVRYETLAPLVEAFRQVDNRHPAYINLNNADNLISYLEVIAPDVISYDRYQWYFGSGDYYTCLENFRSAAKARNAPLICWVESIADEKRNRPPDNLEKLRQSVYSSLAYGAKGIQWWGWSPDNADVATINAELNRLGPVLLECESVDVWHTEPYPWSTWPAPEDYWVRTPAGEMILGVMKDRQERDLLLVVNRNWQNEREAPIEFEKPVSAVKRFDRKTGEWLEETLSEKDGTSMLMLKIGKGDGELLRIERDCH